MTILVWGIIIALAVLLCWSLWLAAEHTGRIKERNETLEKGIKDARKSTKVEESVAMLSDADVTRKLSKYKRPF